MHARGGRQGPGDRARVRAPAGRVPRRDLHRHRRRRRSQRAGPAEDLPDGVALDVDLRWRALVRLATLGAIDLDELDGELAADPTGRRPGPATRARASLPTAEAKAYAWACFTGEVDVANYELEAAGVGLWRWGQE